MQDGVHPLIGNLVDICASKGVCDFIVAPGSRSAPLTIALARHPQIHIRLIYDERSAGYVALGLAQQLGRAVGLVCTSGTAAVNFAPAIVEAFYQGVPLLVLTADRPPEWIDQQDNQAIHQTDLYAPHVRGSFTLPLDDGQPDTAWFTARTVSTAIDLAQGWESGPVHINIPLREPLYPPPAPVARGQATPHVAVTAPAQPQLTPAAWDDLTARWQAAPRKLVIAGMRPRDPALKAALATLAQDPTVAIFADVTANLAGAPGIPVHASAILGAKDPVTLDALRPDLVVSFGGQVVSKEIKTLLRSRPPQALWHVGPGAIAPDTFQALTDVIHMQPAAFFAELATRVAPQTDGAGLAGGYQAAWSAAECTANTIITDFFAAAPFGEFAAVYQILNALPAGARLQLGNSMAVRYADLAGVQPAHIPSQINSNRGTSGIDGTVSTAVGAALADHVLTTLIVGDLGFFYDRNGLWHPHVPANLRIVVLNNHGGGIFDIIEGPGRLPRAEQERYFLTPQPLSARRTAEDHGLAYFFATTQPELASLLPAFFAASGPALLEVETAMDTNTANYRALRIALAALTLAS